LAAFVIPNPMKRIFLAYLPQLDIETLKKLILPQLNKNEIETFHLFKHPSRRKEWLAIRWLLKNHLGFIPKIHYKENGKPFLKSLSSEISISHSRDFAAVCISNYPCAVDIDNWQRNYTSVASRYLSPQEYNAYSGEQKKLALAWMAKEATYKIIGQSQVIFASQISVSIPQEINNFGYFYGTFFGQKQTAKLIFTYYKLDKNFLVIAEYEN